MRHSDHRSLLCEVKQTKKKPNPTTTKKKSLDILSSRHEPHDFKTEIVGCPGKSWKERWVFDLPTLPVWIWRRPTGQAARLLLNVHRFHTSNTLARLRPVFLKLNPILKALSASKSSPVVLCDHNSVNLKLPKLHVGVSAEKLSIHVSKTEALKAALKTAGWMMTISEEGKTICIDFGCVKFDLWFLESVSDSSSKTSAVRS